MKSLGRFNKIPASYYTRSVSIESDITKLVASGAGEIYVKFGDHFAMVVAAEYFEDLDLVDVKKEQEKLIIGTKGNNVTTGNATFILGGVSRPQTFTFSSKGMSICQTKGRVVCGIVVPRLDKVKITGAANVTIIDAFQDVMNLVITGSGTISANGETREVDAEISGAGNIEMNQLKAINARLKISGSGSICGHVSNKVSANISGVGNITLFGDPASLSEKITGIGKLVVR